MLRKKLVKKFWDRSHFLNTKNKRYSKQVIKLIEKKAKEDKIKNDITTDALIKKSKNIEASIVSKQEGIVAGIEEISLFLKKNKLNFIVLKKDGQRVKDKEIIIKIKGNARKILVYERTILNILQRMSGIATKTYELNRITKGHCCVAGTRKTLFDLLDKKSISVGGGLTHRLNLNDSILIKDNHLKILNNDIKKALALANKTKTKFIEIEVENENEAIDASRAISNLKSNKLFAIMFDNMNPIEIKKTVKKIKALDKNILFEASGNINDGNIRKYSKTGVDIVSLGSVTHSAKAFDLSLGIE
ncbi:nicotinate-nucleotide diphosphorylase (carboxylating) [Candidatus Woesearchaeota archaeon]|nr:nicotinate-nucleotide diphosphorylase (carboxylating) [Candidatus Woesearchaeota archaeon]|tara:strand:+ start:1378 stop:2286 length:909 start_codon:yes stop_codon:yes gene_type:complete